MELLSRSTSNNSFQLFWFLWSIGNTFWSIPKVKLNWCIWWIDDLVWKLAIEFSTPLRKNTCIGYGSVSVRVHASYSSSMTDLNEVLGNFWCFGNWNAVLHCEMIPAVTFCVCVSSLIHSWDSWFWEEIQKLAKTTMITTTQLISQISIPTLYYRYLCHTIRDVLQSIYEKPALFN